MKKLYCRSPFTPWRCTHCDRETIDAAPPRARWGMVCSECIDAGRPPGEPFVPLTVAPRLPAKPDGRPIIAVSIRDRQALTEDGELLTLDQLVDRLAERLPGRPHHLDVDQLPAAIVITDCARDLVGYLDRQAKLTASPHWQFRFAIRPRSTWRDGKPRPSPSIGEPVAAQFGFARQSSDGVKRAGGRSRYYQLLDPSHFSPAAATRMDGATLAQLLAFARDVRDFCNRQQLRFATSAAEVGAQLLRDRRFWPAWRRKVPERTNERARQVLPGNHYQLVGVADGHDLIARAHKIDLRSAHHHAAVATCFPHADTLRAHGYYRGQLPDDGAPAAWPARRVIPAGRSDARKLLRAHGLFLLVLSVRPAAAADPLAPTFLRAPGLVYRYVWSTERDTLAKYQAAGLVRVCGLAAAWCSPDTDDGLREYALWSLGQVEGIDPARRAWLKPALLAAYGLLAVRPRRHASAFRWSRSQRELEIYTHEGALLTREQSTARPRPAPIANVIARGLIEARVRDTVLARARQLRDTGVGPLSIYADAIICRDRPPDAVGWRYEGALTSLRFYDPTHYESDQEHRLPGFARRRREDAGLRLARWQQRRSAHDERGGPALAHLHDGAHTRRALPVGDERMAPAPGRPTSTPRDRS